MKKKIIKIQDIKISHLGTFKEAYTGGLGGGGREKVGEMFL